MATFTGEIRDRQILLFTRIAVSGADLANPPLFASLLDTGAQLTMISQRVVEQVGLQGDGYKQITPVTGDPFVTKKYRIWLDIPIRDKGILPDGSTEIQTFFRGQDMEVALLPYLPNDHDVIIGMDFLLEFHFTMHNGLFILSI